MAETVSLMGHPDLSERTHQVIKAEILSGTLAPGSRLVIVELANRLGISRTPVADALNRLVGEGYVTEVARKGYFVATLSKHDVAQVAEASIVLQQGAVELGINRASAEQIAEMKRLVAETERLVDDQGSYTDYAMFLRLCREFHMLVVATAQNRYLVDMYTMIRDHAPVARAHQALEFDTSLAVGALREHRSIVDAFESRDVAAAKAAIADHLRAGERSFEHAFGSSPEASQY